MAEPENEDDFKGGLAFNCVECRERILVQFDETGSLPDEVTCECGRPQKVPKPSEASPFSFLDEVEIVQPSRSEPFAFYQEIEVQNEPIKVDAESEVQHESITVNAAIESASGSITNPLTVAKPSNLIPCLDCDNPISLQAFSCPNCGRPYRALDTAGLEQRLRVEMRASKSYVTGAIQCFVLFLISWYCYIASDMLQLGSIGTGTAIIVWIAAALATICLFNESNADEKITKVTASGNGCLAGLLIVFVGIPILFFFTLIGKK